MQTHLPLKKGGYILFFLLLMNLQLPLYAAGSPTELRVSTIPDSYTYMQAGDLITFTVMVENKSVQTFSDVLIEKSITGDVLVIEDLAPGSAESIDFIYEITESDLEKKELTSDVLATATRADGQVITDNMLMTLFRGKEGADITITKTADPQVFEEAGDVISYTIMVYNTGSTKLYNIGVVDELTADNWSVTNLSPGDAQGFIAEYIVKPADMALGYIINTAEVTGEDIDGNIVTDSDTETVTAMAHISQLTITKTADPQEYEAVGDTISYVIMVVNTGINKIIDIEVTDELTADHWSVTDLSPGDSQGFLAKYVVRQRDLDNLKIVNTAEVTGQDLEGFDVYSSDEETVYAVNITPDFMVNKSAEPMEYSETGQTISYHIDIVNTGNVTIYDIDISDDVTGDNWFIATLRPESERSFSTTYSITQHDMDAGSVVNEVTAHGSAPDGESMTRTDEAVITAVGRQADMSITATASPTVFSDAGESIGINISVMNTGNLSLYNIEVRDDLTGDTWTVASILPGDEEELSATYVTGQADVDREFFETTVTAEAEDPDGNMLMEEEEFRVNLINVPGGLTPDTAFDDELVIIGIEYYPNNSLQIFNRQGTLVFEEAPYQNRWDGTPNRGNVALDSDGRLPGGTYFYILDLGGDQELFTGSIYLIKP